MSRCRLAIAIPTFERSNVIANNLPLLLEEAARLNIEVYLSDDSRDDKTEEIASELSYRYGNLNYRRNSPSFGHDRNIVASVTWPDADYVWILGDIFSIQPGGLGRILSLLEDQDFFFINWQRNDLSVRQTVIGMEAVCLLKDCLWHQALTGATIYSRKVIQWVKNSDDKYHRNFPHLDIILGYANRHPITLGWLGCKVLLAERKKSYWINKALDVFVDDWGAVISSYTTIILPSELPNMIKSHSKNTQLFHAKFLLSLREGGHLTLMSLRRRYFWHAMHIKPWKVLFITVMPKRLCRRLLGIGSVA